MRPFLYFLSLVLALPGIGLAVAFLILGRAIATQSLPGFLGALLEITVWLIPWGLLAGLAAFVVLVIAGVTARFRWLASACVAVLAIGSSIVVLVLTTAHGNFSPGQLPFFIPAALSAFLGIWLAVREWPRDRLLRSSMGAHTIKRCIIAAMLCSTALSSARAVEPGRYSVGFRMANDVPGWRTWLRADNRGPHSC